MRGARGGAPLDARRAPQEGTSPALGLQVLTGAEPKESGGREALPRPLGPEDKTSGMIIQPPSLRPTPRRPRPVECCSRAAGPGP